MSSKKENEADKPRLREPGEIINEMTEKAVREGRKIGENIDAFDNYRKPGTGERGHENPDKTWAMFIIYQDKKVGDVIYEGDTQRFIDEMKGGKEHDIYKTKI